MRATASPDGDPHSVSQVSRKMRCTRQHERLSRARNGHVKKSALLFKGAIRLWQVGIDKRDEALHTANHDNEICCEALRFVEAHQSHVIHVGWKFGLCDPGAKCIP